MSRSFTTFVAVMLCFVASVHSQWQFQGNFPNDAFMGGFGGHGVAVDPDGKVWIQLFGATESIVDATSGQERPVRAIYVFNSDGTPASFSPIKTITVAGVTDTLYGSNRGLRADHQGNILVSHFDALYRLNYKTGAGMNKVIPQPANSLTAPAVDAQGNVYIRTVIPNFPLKVFDANFNFIDNAVNSTSGFARSIAVSADGNTIFDAGFTNHFVTVYSRPDEFSPYTLADSILIGFDSESLTFHPITGHLWASAGSFFNLPNQFPGVTTNWAPNTWYAYDVVNKTIVDSLKWQFNFPNNPNERPRGLAFSNDGCTAYVTCFGANDYPAVQKFVASIKPTVANAGADTAICAGQIVTLGGKPTARDGTRPYTFSWTPTTGLVGPPTFPNPKARPLITTTYTVTVTDAKGCQATDQVTVTVHDAVFVANEYIHLQAPRASEGNLHANGTINFKEGRPSLLKGNLHAGDDILIRSDNTINGDVTAGDHISVIGNAKVTGAVNIVPVPKIPLPVLSFTARGDNITVGQNQSRTLLPGSYGEVKVLTGGRLFLRTGKYFMNKLELNSYTVLRCNVASGPITVNIVDNFKFGEKAQVVITPTSPMSTALVGFITTTEASIKIGAQSWVRGAIIAPNALVTLQQNSRFKGAICAEKIDVHSGARFLHYSSASLLKPDLSDDEEYDYAEENAEEAVAEKPADYELAQNYPNPFNPSTMISFALPEAGKVTVKIFNETGQLVRTLVDREMPAGRQNVQWNGRDQLGNTVTTGVYLYRIVVTGKAGETVFAETKRMTFLK